MRTFTHDGGIDDTIAGETGWLVWRAEEIKMAVVFRLAAMVLGICAKSRAASAQYPCSAACIIKTFSIQYTCFRVSTHRNNCDFLPD